MQGKPPPKTWDTLGLRMEPAVDTALWAREGQHHHQPTPCPGAAGIHCRAQERACTAARTAVPGQVSPTSKVKIMIRSDVHLGA